MKAGKPCAMGIISCILLFLFLGCANKPNANVNPGDESHLTISNQFRRVLFNLRDGVGDGDHYPESLSEITSPLIDTNLLVWHETGNRPGTLRTIEDWGDFIYFGNGTDDVPRAALLISPPENHNGKEGYVLCADGEFFRITLEQTRKLVEAPWILATTTPKDNIDELKLHIRVHVPKRLRAYYHERLE